MQPFVHGYRDAIPLCRSRAAALPSYEYTPEQVEAMFSVLESKVAEVKAKFTVTKNKENAAFSFGNKAGQEN